MLGQIHDILVSHNYFVYVLTHDFNKYIVDV